MGTLDQHSPYSCVADRQDSRFHRRRLVPHRIREMDREKMRQRGENFRIQRRLRRKHRQRGRFPVAPNWVRCDFVRIELAEKATSRIGAITRDTI